MILIKRLVSQISSLLIIFLLCLGCQGKKIAVTTTETTTVTTTETTVTTTETTVTTTTTRPSQTSESESIVTTRPTPESGQGAETLFWPYIFVRGRLYTGATHSAFNGGEIYRSHMIVPFHDDDPDPDTFIQDQKLEQIGVVQRTHNTEIPSGEFVAAHVSVGAPVYAVPSDEDSLYIVEYLNDSGEDYQLRLFIPVTFNVEENDLFFSGQP